MTDSMTDSMTAGDAVRSGEGRRPRPRRAQETRAALLAGAARVFAKAGYADAGVIDIVEQAGTSVGSLYHHFGSKADLYVQLYVDYQSRQQRRSGRAFRASRARGQADPMAPFLVGTRAYLEGAWQERQIAAIFVPGGGPPEFDRLVRRRFQDWLAINAEGLEQQARPFSPTLLLILTAIVTEAGREITRLPSRDRALGFIEEVLGLMSQLRPQEAAR